MNKVIDKGFRSCRFVSTIVKHPVCCGTVRCSSYVFATFELVLSRIVCSIYVCVCFFLMLFFIKILMLVLPFCLFLFRTG